MGGGKFCQLYSTESFLLRFDAAFAKSLQPLVRSTAYCMKFHSTQFSSVVLQFLLLQNVLCRIIETSGYSNVAMAASNVAPSGECELVKPAVFTYSKKAMFPHSTSSFRSGIKTPI